MVAAYPARDPDRDPVWNAGRRPRGSHRGHLHDHDHAGDRCGVLLLHPPELRDLQRLHRLQQRHPAGPVRRRLAPGGAILLSDARLRDAVLSGGRVDGAHAVRAGAARRARQPAAHECARLFGHRPSHSGLLVRERDCGGRRHPARLAECPGRARNGRHSAGDRHSGDCRRRRSQTPDRPVHRGAHLHGAQRVLVRYSAGVRDVGRAVQARRWVGFSGCRVLLPGWRARAVGALAGRARSGSSRDLRPGTGRRGHDALRRRAPERGGLRQRAGAARRHADVRRARRPHRCHPQCASRRAPRRARLQRRRQDHVVQLRHRRLSADLGHHPLLRRGRDEFSAARAHPPRPASHLPDFRAVHRPVGARQRLSRLPRRLARALLVDPPARRRHPAAVGRKPDRGRAPAGRARSPGRGAEPRPAAPARDRAGAGRRAALHPVRRAGRRPVAQGARPS